MPRDGSGVYNAPAGTTASPNTTIESSKYNALVADLVSDANAARPVTAGGTGATTAVGAMDELHTKATDIASASTTDLSAATGTYVNITGTNTITSFGTADAGVIRFVRFQNGLTITHNGSVAPFLLLPGNANIAAAAGDTALLVSDGSGSWRCLHYQRRSSVPFSLIDEDDMASNSAVVVPSQQSVKAYVDSLANMTLLGTLTLSSGTSHAVTDIPSAYRKLYIEVDGVSFNASDYLQIELSSTNGAAYGAARQIGPTVTAGDNVAGFVEVGDIRSTSSNGKSLLSAVLSTSNTPPSQVVQRPATNTAAACDAIRFSGNGGSTFDSGAIRVYGVR